MKFSIKSIAMISWIIISIGLCFAVKSVLAGSFSDAFGVLIGILIVAIFSYFLIVYWKKVRGDTAFILAALFSSAVASLCILAQIAERYGDVRVSVRVMSSVILIASICINISIIIYVAMIRSIKDK